MAKVTAYCFGCKENVNVKNAKVVKKDGRNVLQGKCDTPAEHNVSKFVSKDFKL